MFHNHQNNLLKNNIKYNLCANKNLIIPKQIPELLKYLGGQVLTQEL